MSRHTDVRRRRILRAFGTVAAGTTASGVGAGETASGLDGEATDGPRSMASIQEDSGETWPSFQYDWANTGVVPADWTPVEPPLAERWSFRSESDRADEDERYRGPVVADGRVFVGTAESNLYALEVATGDHLWTFETIGTGTPTIDGDTVYVGSLDNYLYALAAATGDVRWELDTGSSLRTAPVVVEDTVYVMQGDFGSDVIAVDAASGEQLWSYYPGFAGPYMGAPAYRDGRIYVAAAADQSFGTPDVSAVDAETGEQVWEFSTDVDSETDDDGDTTLESYGNPVVTGDGVYVGGQHGFLFALSTADGTKRWERELGRIYGDLAVDGDTLYAKTASESSLVALDTADGSERWRVGFGGYGSSNDSSPVVVGDVVLVQHNGTLHLVDSTAGEILETHSLGGGPMVTPAVVDGTVYTGGGAVYALEHRDPTPTRTPEPTTAPPTTGRSTTAGPTTGQPTASSPVTDATGTPPETGTKPRTGTDYGRPTLTRQRGTNDRPAAGDGDGDGDDGDGDDAILTRITDPDSLLGVGFAVGGVLGGYLLYRNARPDQRDDDPPDAEGE
jgi:outer membrane protein assembly factor BamB